MNNIQFTYKPSSIIPGKMVVDQVLYLHPDGYYQETPPKSEQDNVQTGKSLR